MLFGVVLFVWYLLDRPRRAVYVASRSGRPSLFPSRTDIRVRRLGAYLLWALPILLAVMILGKAFAIAQLANTARENIPDLKLDEYVRTYLSGRYYLLFGIAGYLLSMLLAWLLFSLDERWKIRERIANWPLFIRQPGFTSGRVLRRNIPLHAISAYLVCVGLIFLAIAIALLTMLNNAAPGRVVTSPVVLVCLVCILITQVYGYWSCHIQVGTLSVIVLFLALAAWNSSSVFPEADYKFRFPGLDEYSTPERRVDLGQLNNDGYIGMTPPAPGGRPQLQDRDILEQINNRWQETPR